MHVYWFMHMRVHGEGCVVCVFVFMHGTIFSYTGKQLAYWL